MRINSNRKRPASGCLHGSSCKSHGTPKKMSVFRNSYCRYRRDVESRPFELPELGISGSEGFFLSEFGEQNITTQSSLAGSIFTRNRQKNGGILVLMVEPSTLRFPRVLSSWTKVLLLTTNTSKDTHHKHHCEPKKNNRHPVLNHLPRHKFSTNQSASVGSQSVTKYSSHPSKILIPSSSIANPLTSAFSLILVSFTLLGNGTYPCCRLHRTSN